MCRIRTLRVAAVALAAVLAAAGLAGCGGREVSSGGDGDTLKVGLAYDIGGRGDKSFNDAAYAGLQRVQKELDLEVRDLEAADGESDDAKIQRLTLLAQEGFNPVIGVGFAYAPAMEEVAPKFPNVRFAIVDDGSVEQPNLTNLVFAEHEGSFLVGAAAALKSESGTIGFVGGVETPLIRKFEAGYVQGAEKVDPDIEIDTQYISQPPDNSGFRDSAKAKTVTQGMIDDGADVVYHAAGLSGVGVIETAASNRKWVIGVDSDQYRTAPQGQRQYILTSMLKRVDTAVFNFVESVGDGSARGGPIEFDLANNGVDYSRSNSQAVGDITDELDSYKQQIIDGKIEVSSE